MNKSLAPGIPADACHALAVLAGCEYYTGTAQCFAAAEPFRLSGPTVCVDCRCGFLRQEYQVGSEPLPEPYPARLQTYRLSSNATGGCRRQESRLSTCVPAWLAPVSLPFANGMPERDCSLHWEVQ